MVMCKEATRLLSQAEERKLSSFDRVRLHFHLALCDPCVQFKAQLVLLRAAFTRYRSGG